METEPSQPGWMLRRISVVIPTLNEAENLPLVLARVPEWVHEVVIVDGHSVDGTLDAARAAWPNDHVVRMERRESHREVRVERRRSGRELRLVLQPGRGKGDALRAGFAAATGEIVVMLDADGSTAPEEIARFVDALVAGADFVKGSRFLPGGGTADMPLYRKLGNWGFVMLVRLLFGGRYTDLCYGYNAFWKAVVPQLRLDGDGFEIETMMNVRALQSGLRIAEVPSFEAERMYGTSRLKTFPDGWRVLRTIWREWRSPIVCQLPAPSHLRPVGELEGIHNPGHDEVIRALPGLRAGAILAMPVNLREEPKVTWRQAD